LTKSPIQATSALLVIVGLAGLAMALPLSPKSSAAHPVLFIGGFFAAFAGLVLLFYGRLLVDGQRQDMARPAAVTAFIAVFVLITAALSGWALAVAGGRNTELILSAACLVAALLLELLWHRLMLVRWRNLGSARS
jgi:hypothetical protein